MSVLSARRRQKLTIERDTESLHPTSNSQEMHHCIRAPSNSLQDCDGILERLAGENL